MATVLNQSWAEVLKSVPSADSFVLDPTGARYVHLGTIGTADDLLVPIKSHDVEWLHDLNVVQYHFSPQNPHRHAVEQRLDDLRDDAREEGEPFTEASAEQLLAFLDAAPR